MKLRLFLVLILASGLGGCGGARLVTFPYDPSGRSLNSPFGEVTPRIADRYIVFSSDRRGSQDIYLYDTMAQTLIELPGLNAIDTLESNPGVSVNGRFIVFAGNRQGQSGIYLYDRDTRQLRNLTDNLRAAVRNPVISADGNVIAFEASVNGQWDILLYNRMGQPINGANPSQ